MEENEAAQEAQLEADATKAARKALLKAASLPDMDTLFEDVMTKGDGEVVKLLNKYWITPDQPEYQQMKLLHSSSVAIDVSKSK